MKNIIIILAVLFTSCKNASIKTDAVSIGEYKFELIQKEKDAVLKTILKDKEVELKLKLKPPCYFLRVNGELQTFEYEDIGVENVAIIIGDIADKSKKNKYGVDSDEICGEKLQGLVLKNNNIIITDKTISGSLSCKDSGLDEKDFWDFAHL